MRCWICGARADEARRCAIPYRSLAQQRFFHSSGARKAGISKATVEHYDKVTNFKKLPARAKKKK
jgi:hypothetical protein